MRALVATALTLAFLAMAGITYLAVAGDPMGGEPRFTLKIAPPETIKPKPVAAAPAASTQVSRQLPDDSNSVPAAAVEQRSLLQQPPADDVAGIVIGPAQ